MLGAGFLAECFKRATSDRPATTYNGRRLQMTPSSTDSIKRIRQRYSVRKKHLGDHHRWAVDTASRASLDEVTATVRGSQRLVCITIGIGNPNFPSPIPPVTDHRCRLAQWKWGGRRDHAGPNASTSRASRRQKQSIGARSKHSARKPAPSIS